jgi:large subunit ribosomal protein L20
MVRVKKGKITTRKRKKILKQTKGFKWSRKSKKRAAKEALLHKYSHSFHDRRKKKREFRKLWQVKKNAAARQHGLSYSKFINQLKKQNIGLDRKLLARLAESKPEIFKKILEKTKGEEKNAKKTKLSK